MFSKIVTTVEGWFHKAADKAKQTLAKIESLLQEYDLTPAHVAHIAQAIKTVEAEVGSTKRGLEKAQIVADGLQTLTGDLALPAAAQSAIGAVVGLVHQVVSIHDEIAAAHAA